jgi:hypothetical protein
MEIRENEGGTSLPLFAEASAQSGDILHRAWAGRGMAIGDMNAGDTLRHKK